MRTFILYTAFLSAVAGRPEINLTNVNGKQTVSSSVITAVPITAPVTTTPAEFASTIPDKISDLQNSASIHPSQVINPVNMTAVISDGVGGGSHINGASDSTNSAGPTIAEGDGGLSSSHSEGSSNVVGIGDDGSSTTLEQGENNSGLGGETGASSSPGVFGSGINVEDVVVPVDGASLPGGNPSNIIATGDMNYVGPNDISFVGNTDQAVSPTSANPITVDPTSSSAGLPATGLWPPNGHIQNEKPNRRLITYDQRQDGQYNIRADLENFMIVLIPPNSNDGLNLLDLLTKASYKRGTNHLKSPKKKYGIPASSSSSSSSSPSSSSSSQSQSQSQHHQYLATENGKVRHSNFLSKEGIHHISHQQVPHYGDNVIIGTETSADAEQNVEYIEGRTPYHVDISSNSDDGGPQARMQSDRQVVDVLPPPYPLAYQQLMKPYHLEAQATVIQTLPPQELDVKRASGNYLEAYEQVVPPKPVESNAATSQGGNFLIPPASNLHENNNSSITANKKNDKVVHNNRYPRAIRGNSFMDVGVTNRLLNDHPSTAMNHRLSTALLPLYRSDMSMGAAQLYPPIDVPRPTGIDAYLTLKMTDTSDNDHKHDFDDTMVVGSPQSLDHRPSLGYSSEIVVPPVQLGDEFAFDLHGGESFNDPDTKALLSDGIERCAPGKRRDSYGVCREIEGY